ncbi:hypothetical protein [Zongyangia hominis]|nr:hypothetical protein [Zongyangia hominis]
MKERKTKKVIGVVAAVVAVGATLCAAIVRTQALVGSLLGDMTTF